MRLGRLAAVTALAGCGSAAVTTPNPAFDWGDAGADEDAAARLASGSSGGSRGVGATAPWDWQAASTVDCPSAAKRVYVTGSGGALYSFDPPTLAFHEVGTIKCASSPSHMTVDRHGVAWVVSDGRLYRVDTANAHCAEVATWKPHATRFPDFALTFLGTSSAADPLFVLGETSELLATFDPTSGLVTPIGTVKLTASIGDLTSDGRGGLYLLVDEDPRALVKLDPTSAASVASYPINAAPVSDQALAHYGGDFYPFEGTLIFRHDVTTRTIAAIGSAPLSVTGARQSTCVP